MKILLVVFLSSVYLLGSYFVALEINKAIEIEKNFEKKIIENYR